jgi:hypothetical protein
MGAMSTSDKPSAQAPSAQTTPKPQTPEAERALAEAEARRHARDPAAVNPPAEKGGRGGLDPARYGDWEIKGLTSDF